MELVQIIGWFVIAVFIIVLIVLMILMKMNYPSSLEKERHRDFWNLYGAEYISTPPFPKYTNSKDKGEQEEFDKFNRLVMLFWLNFLLLFLGVSLLNV